MKQMQLILHIGVDAEKTLICFRPELLDGGCDVFMGFLDSNLKIFVGGNGWFGRHSE